MLFAVWQKKERKKKEKKKKKSMLCRAPLSAIYAQGYLFSGRSYQSGDFSQAAQTALLPTLGSWHTEQQETHL